MTFELTPPNRYTPRGATAIERMIIEKYLPHWGVLVMDDAP